MVTKKALYETVWKEPYLDNENILNVHVRRLRMKIEDDPNTPLIVKTVWGSGYIVENMQ